MEPCENNPITIWQFLNVHFVFKFPSFLFEKTDLSQDILSAASHNLKMHSGSSLIYVALRWEAAVYPQHYATNNVKLKNINLPIFHEGREEGCFKIPKRSLSRRYWNEETSNFFNCFPTFSIWIEKRTLEFLNWFPAFSQEKRPSGNQHNFPRYERKVGVFIWNT